VTDYQKNSLFRVAHPFGHETRHVDIDERSPCIITTSLSAISPQHRKHLRRIHHHQIQVHMPASRAIAFAIMLLPVPNQVYIEGKTMFTLSTCGSICPQLNRRPTWRAIQQDALWGTQQSSRVTTTDNVEQLRPSKRQDDSLKYGVHRVLMSTDVYNRKDGAQTHYYRPRLWGAVVSRYL